MWFAESPLLCANVTPTPGVSPHRAQFYKLTPPRSWSVQALTPVVATFSNPFPAARRRQLAGNELMAQLEKGNVSPAAVSRLLVINLAISLGQLLPD